MACTISSLVLVLLLAVCVLSTYAAGVNSSSSSQRPLKSYNIPTKRPLTIAHRGASGVLPEHTIRAYEQSIEDGADYIECDVTLTKDQVPICNHENYLSPTTDVADRPEFADRRRTLTIPGAGTFNDWFAIDFTRAELKTLRKKQARSYRDQTFNGMYDIPTFEEFLLLAAFKPEIGIYPELKDPVFLNTFLNGTRFEDIVLNTLSRYGYDDASDLCYLQCFNELTLGYLAERTTLPLVMLIDMNSPDSALARWRDMGIDGVGVSTTAVSNYYNSQNGYKNWISETTDIIQRSHAHGFAVHVWTMRNEDRFLAWDWQQDINLAFDHFLSLEVDGFFTDFPLTLVRYLDQLYSEGNPQ